MVSEKGRANDVQVLSDPGHGSAEKAVEAVKRWKFDPAVTNEGKKVATQIQIQVVSRQLGS